MVRLFGNLGKQVGIKRECGMKNFLALLLLTVFNQPKIVQAQYDYPVFKEEKKQSQFLGMKGRDYFHLSTSAMTLFTAKGNNDFNIDPALKTSTIDLSADIGYELSYRIGFDFDGPFRTELEYSFWDIDLDEATEEPRKIESLDDLDVRANIPIYGYVNGHSFSINLFYTYAPGGDFNSYFGGGLGFSEIVTEVGISGTDQATAPHVQGFIGSEYLLNRSKKITLGYKVRAIINPDLEVFKESIVTHGIELGLIFYFN